MLDYDNDGWPDVYVANDSTASLLFHNNHDGTFKEVGLQAGVALTADGRAQAGMGLTAADYDRDGWLDIVKTNFDDDTPSLYRNLGGGTFEDATRAAGLGSNTRYLGWGTGFIDFDLDSWPDILIVNGHVYPEADRVGGRYSYEQPKLLYRNLRQRTLRGRLGARRPGAAREEGVARRGVRRSLQHRPAGRRRQQHARRPEPAAQLRDGRPDTAWWCSWSGTRSNRSAIGARVTVHRRARRLIDEVRSGGSFCSQNDLRIHVGLGDADARRSRGSRVARAARPRRSTGVDADQLVVIREGSRRGATRAAGARERWRAAQRR